MAAGDLNRDGHLDLITGDGLGTVEVFLGNGDGTFREQPAFDDGGASLQIEDSQFLLADFYGNGNLDLVTGNFGYQESPVSINLWQGRGDGTFSNVKFLNAGYYPAWFAAADMNGDGKLDLLVANSVSNSVTVLLNQGSGNFTSSPDNYATPQFLAGQGQGPISVGEFNGDHKPDVVVAGNIGVDVLLNLGAGVLYAPGSVEVGFLTSLMYAADFNSDGHPDLAVEDSFFNGSGNVHLLTGDGKGNLTYSEFIIQDEGFAPLGPLALGSFNGNSHPGVAAAAPGESLDLAYNDGHGAFSSSYAQLAGDGFEPVSLCAGDFNRDGFSDLAVIDGNGVDVYLNTRERGFSPHISHAPIL